MVERARRWKTLGLGKQISKLIKKGGQEVVRCSGLDARAKLVADAAPQDTVVMPPEHHSEVGEVPEYRPKRAEPIAAKHDAEPAERDDKEVHSELFVDDKARGLA